MDVNEWFYNMIGEDAQEVLLKEYKHAIRERNTLFHDVIDNFSLEQAKHILEFIKDKQEAISYKHTSYLPVEMQLQVESLLLFIKGTCNGLLVRLDNLYTDPSLTIPNNNVLIDTDLGQFIWRESASLNCINWTLDMANDRDREVMESQGKKSIPLYQLIGAYDEL